MGLTDEQEKRMNDVLLTLKEKTALRLEAEAKRRS
jgi:hypothetical protein